MRRTTLTRLRLLAGLALVAGVLGGTATAQPPAATPAEAKIDTITGAVIVPLGNLVKYDPKNGKLITAVLTANEEIVYVEPDKVNPKILSITAKREGLTKVSIQFSDKSQTTIDVLVQPDYELLRKILKQTVPTANVTITPGAGGTIILSGYVNRVEDADIVQRIASSAVGGNITNVINALQVGGVQHVLIDVVVAQVDRTELRERGVSLGVTGTSFGVTSVLGGLATSNIGSATGGAGPLSVGANSNITVGIVPASLTGAIRALRTEGVAKFLSEPKVITQSGRPALLRIGGQQAILGPSSGINGPGVVLEQVGTQMEVLPIVFGNGKIYLEVNPQFRSVNTGRGVTTAFGFTPGFNESSIRSSVYMEPGQTYAIGGLLESQVQTSAQKVPYLGDMPLLGAAFSYLSHEERETELVILVTPRLVDAMDCNQLPKRVPGKETRSPDDYELFLESLIEAPRGQRRPWTNGTYTPAYKNDPNSYGKFPCVGADGRVIPGCNPATGMQATSVSPASLPATVQPAPVVAATAEVPLVLPMVESTPTPPPAPQ